MNRIRIRRISAVALAYLIPVGRAYLNATSAAHVVKLEA